MTQLKEFENLSLKQKMNNCITHFASYLSQNNLANPEWKTVLKVLEEINKIEYLDEWFYKYCEIIPDSILEEINFEKNKDKWEYIDRDTFKILYQLYSNLTSHQIIRISELMGLIHEVCSIELYTDSKSVSQHSIIPYSKFMSIIGQ